MKRVLLFLVLSIFIPRLYADNFHIARGESVSVCVSEKEAPVVQTAVSILQKDFQAVLASQLLVNSGEYRIIIASRNNASGRSLLATTGVDFSWLDGQAQAFVIAVSPDNRLVIAGSDQYGTAYGIIEVTRMLGVSAWEWWGDVTPYGRTSLTLRPNYVLQSSPNVSFRGIFINDEDFAFLPWVTKVFEPNDKGEIGEKTTEKIFELLLRLRANLYWPPMHEVSRPFFLTEGLRELAQRYGIFIGTSHCEPMACNANGEWKERGVGAYDYASNKENVLNFWETRVKETARQPMMYTLGIRGIHDGPMSGANTLEEKKQLLEQVISDQRALLTKHVSKRVDYIPQVFIPYKEVEDIYKAGLQLPDDVTLMWCDDNYGYIRHFPTELERQRSGGNGIYYHASYWGRPHDYLWSSSASPFLMYQQMSEAYYHGAARVWVLNVGDIKPLEYQISLFMDMAWDIEKVTKTTISTHLENFYSQTLNPEVARLASIYMKKYYNYVFQCKPEHMAGTRTEETDLEWTKVKDLPWSEAKIRKRLSAFDKLTSELEWLADSIRRSYPERYDAFYELCEYPLVTASAVNTKYCCAMLARHNKTYMPGESVADTWRRSDQAHDKVVQMTEKYNQIRKGKWKGIMNASPRDLTVFKPLSHDRSTTQLTKDPATIATFYGASYDAANFGGEYILAPVLGLGTSIRAMPIPKNFNVTYKFNYNLTSKKELIVEVHMLPTHPIEEQQRFSLSLDGGTPVVFTYNTEGRSETWKQNVLRNYAVVIARLPVTLKRGNHSLVLTALDEGVVVDELFVRK
ncbi:MAG: glycosyl hydrolase 115 family protein [Bacteroidaceae bacterium]|nr:glycosyl hydrolase 115 family protein [Bacteroidaceae bacterium]